MDEGDKYLKLRYLDCIPMKMDNKKQLITAMFCLPLGSSQIDINAHI